MIPKSSSAIHAYSSGQAVIHSDEARAGGKGVIPDALNFLCVTLPLQPAQARFVFVFHAKNARFSFQFTLFCCVCGAGLAPAPVGTGAAFALTAARLGLQIYAFIVKKVCYTVQFLCFTGVAL